jgi:hypothetical protein
MYAPDGLLAIIEVKSNQNRDFILERLSQRQKRRLQNVFEFFTARGCEVCFFLAFVDDQNKVQVFEDF